LKDGSSSSKKPSKKRPKIWLPCTGATSLGRWHCNEAHFENSTPSENQAFFCVFSSHQIKPTHEKTVAMASP
ncbi:MAG: hypothetical protein AAFV25_15250, partial [Bacteroidota bacterium]